MAWQRKIPFGYQMRQGEVVPSREEADTVKQIFSMYIEGLSLVRIAKRLSEQGVRYHAHTGEWNKNMIKRILDNRRYLGDGIYPRLIDDGTFHAAELQKEDRTIYAPCELPKEIRSRLKCGVCGAPLTRKHSESGITSWRCSDNDSHNAVRISDETLAANVQELLNRLLTERRLTRPIPVPKERETVSNSRRIANELTNAFNRGEENYEYMRTLILTCATEKYNELPDNSFQYELDILCSSAKGENNETLMKKLLNTAVRAILLTRGEDISLKLVSGEVIRKEDHKCDGTENGNSYSRRPEI